METVTITANDYTACETYCLERSWRLRLVPKASKRLIRQVLREFTMEGEQGEVEKQLRRFLQSEIGWEHSNADKPIRSAALIWLLLRIILPIIVKLVIQWFKAREQGGWTA